MKLTGRFWMFYTLAWLFYALSLGTVFLSVGFKAQADLLVQIICNILPSYLLGIGVVFLCQKLKWRSRNEPKFILTHFVALFSFPVLWTLLTLLNFTLINFFKSGDWSFASWDYYGWQWQFFTGLMAYLTISCAVYLGKINRNLQDEARRNAELELRAVRAEAARNQAELFALRSQLNPHFLFNTLHSLMNLVRHNPHKAEEAIERFSEMLRYVLQMQKEQKTFSADVTFAEEWRFVENYLELEKLRLGNRLQVESEIEKSAFEYILPAFTVQPLIENAVKHSISTRINGGKISVSAKVRTDKLHIEIFDDGSGTSFEKSVNSNGLGLNLVKENLKVRFGDESEFDISSEDKKGFCVLLKIPKVSSI